MRATYPLDLFARGETFVKSLSMDYLSEHPPSVIAKQFAEQNNLYNTCIEGIGVVAGIYHHAAIKGFEVAKAAREKGDVSKAGLGLNVMSAFIAAQGYPLAECPDMAASVLGARHEELAGLIKFAHPDLVPLKVA